MKILNIAEDVEMSTLDNLIRFDMTDYEIDMLSNSSLLYKLNCISKNLAPIFIMISISVIVLLLYIDNEHSMLLFYIVIFLLTYCVCNVAYIIYCCALTNKVLASLPNCLCYTYGKVKVTKEQYSEGKNKYYLVAHTNDYGDIRVSYQGIEYRTYKDIELQYVGDTDEYILRFIIYNNKPIAIIF